MSLTIKDTVKNIEGVINTFLDGVNPKRPVYQGAEFTEESIIKHNLAYVDFYLTKAALKDPLDIDAHINRAKMRYFDMIPGTKRISETSEYKKIEKSAKVLAAAVIAQNKNISVSDANQVESTKSTGVDIDAFIDHANRTTKNFEIHSTLLDSSLQAKVAGELLAINQESSHEKSHHNANGVSFQRGTDPNNSNGVAIN